VAVAAALGGLVLVGTAGCSQQDIDAWQRGGMPAPATEQAPTILTLWQWSWVAALLVGGLVWALILIAVVAYRRRQGDGVPEQTKYNIPIEVLYTVAPLLMIMTLFFFTARDQAELTKVTDDQAMTVGVVGFKWQWGFNYLNDDVHAVGGPNHPAELVLPVDKKVKFELTSPDVIHSFWVPAFLFKMDVIPGRKNVFEVTPNKLGTYPGRCAELCGVDHSKMLFTVRVVSEADYQAYVAGLKAAGQTGKLDTGRTQVAGVTE
jgi:cytochrome c oxidase subunit 2